MYPTKEEILKEKPKFRKGTILITKLWKTTSFKGWKTDKKWIKIEKLILLIEALCTLYRKKNPEIILDNEYYFETRKRIIHLNKNNPSIISTLHELAHYLFKANELKACRWSYWIFKECFLKSLEKLNWNGHMLRK